jgi:DNA replication and repair protein RecF
VLIVGENGAGKTNLLEAMHVGTQGFSPRTRADTQLIRFGEPAARVSLALRHLGVDHDVSVRVGPGAAKTADLDGARAPSTESVRRAFPTLVFTPDRLSVVKGGPIVRRAYFDRVLSRLHPARSHVSAEYAATIQQRNAALRRVQLGLTPREALDPWTARAVELAAALVDGRRATVAAIAPRFATILAELGLPDGSISYDSEPPTLADFERRLAADLATGLTGIGPHRDDVLIAAGGHDLRSYGSQGQQRLALLALLLAEAALVPGSPLFLLDDVLSELDERRRALLARHIEPLEQTIVTATHRALYGAEPSQVVEVAGGQAH